MKNVLAIVTLLIVLIFGCGKNNENFKLESGTPAYELATQLSTTLPYLDPDQNNVLISTNKFKITTDEVVYNMRKNMGNRASQLKNLNDTQLKDNVSRLANILGERRLFLIEAGKANITVTDSQIDSILNLQYHRAGGEENFLKFLATNGQSIEDIKAEIKTGLTVQKYINRVMNEGVSITEDDIQNAYNEDKTYTVRHILLSTQGKSDSAKLEIRKEMEGILAQAKNGKDFAELAKQYSEDPGSKANGGLYKDIQRGSMVKPFEDAAFSVPVGEISNIIETQYGYHILKVLERKKETKPLEEVRQTIENKLKQQKSHEAFQKHLDDLKTQYEYQVVQF